MIGQTGIGKQVTDIFVTMAYAMLVGIGLVYMNMVNLFGSVLVPVVTFSALPPVVISSFVSLAVTGRARDLSVLIVLLMLRDFAVVTNATVLRDFVLHEIEAGDGVRTVLMQADRAHVHSILMRGRVGTCGDRQLARAGGSAEGSGTSRVVPPG